VNEIEFQEIHGAFANQNIIETWISQFKKFDVEISAGRIIITEKVEIFQNSAFFAQKSILKIIYFQG
jgi:hypothetical protein